ncbi:MAG TPA: CHASE domain-containing protein, partial [Burkholderiaceae bacterium]
MPLTSGPTRSRTPLLLALAILALSLLATAYLWREARNDAHSLLRTEFDYQAGETVRRLEQRMATYEQVARGAQSFMLGRIDVGQEDFRLYVANSRVQEKFPGIQGLAVSRLIPADALPAHESGMRALLPGYAVRPPGPRPLYSSITHIEPQTAMNRRALGFDMYAEPVRRAAMERARDTGQAAASGKVTLIQEGRAQGEAGLVMYLPVYARGAPVATLEQRRAALLGWIGAPFRMRDLMAGLSAER